MTTRTDIQPEFSVVVDLDDLPEGETAYDLVADADERAALAARFGLLSLDRFEAQLRLHWLEPGTLLALNGTLSADMVQSCVVTLEPVPSRIDEPVEMLFARDGEASADFVGSEDAEPLEGDRLDIGEIVAEELSLSLDPYPRSPNAEESALRLGPGATLSSDDQPEGGLRRNNPFEVLADINSKL